MMYLSATVIIMALLAIKYRCVNNCNSSQCQIVIGLTKHRSNTIPLILSAMLFFSTFLWAQEKLSSSASVATKCHLLLLAPRRGYTQEAPQPVKHILNLVHHSSCGMHSPGLIMSCYVNKQGAKDLSMGRNLI